MHHTTSSHAPPDAQRPTPADVDSARRWWEAIPLTGREPSSAGQRLHTITRDLSPTVSPEIWVTHTYAILRHSPEPHLRTVAEACTSDAAGAACYGKVLLHWCRVPFEEQQALRKTRGVDQFSYALAGDAGTSSLPPTERQLRYLHVLGYRGEPPATRREAGKLISERKARRITG